MGLCNYAITRTAFMQALDLMPATTNAYLISFVGLVTMGASAVFLKEPPTVPQVIGALISLGGLRVFFRHIPATDELSGILWVAAGVAALAASNIFSRLIATRRAGRLPHDVLAMLSVWSGGAPVVLFGLASESVPQLSASTWGIIAANGLVSTTLWLIVWFRVLRALRAFEASLLASSAVIWVALLAIPLLGERLALHQWVGITTMLVGLYLVQTTGRRREIPA